MTIATGQQIKLFHDFLTGEDGQPRPGVIVSAGGLSTVAKGSWGIVREWNGAPEDVIRLLENSGKITRLPDMTIPALHAQLDSPHIHLGKNMKSFNHVKVLQSEEGNIRITFYASDTLVSSTPVMEAFILDDSARNNPNQGNMIPLVDDVAPIAPYDKDQTILQLQRFCNRGLEVKDKAQFLEMIFALPATVLFTGPSENVANITTARIGARWNLTQEIVAATSGPRLEYFARVINDDYDPAAQNADVQMQGELPDHQKLHSQHVHVHYDLLDTAKLLIGGPNGHEVILECPSRKSGKGSLLFFATKGMSGKQIKNLLAAHKGHLIDGRARS